MIEEILEPQVRQDHLDRLEHLGRLGPRGQEILQAHLVDMVPVVDQVALPLHLRPPK